MPAAWDSKAPLDYIVGLLDSISEIQTVHVGVPLSLTSQVSAYVTMGGHTLKVRLTGGQAQRVIVYRAVIGYAVEGAEDTAEDTLCAAVDAFENLILADLTMGHTLESVEFDASEADTPRYVAVAGSDYREWPIRIAGIQRTNYNTHP